MWGPHGLSKGGMDGPHLVPRSIRLWALEVCRLLESQPWDTRMQGWDGRGGV